MLNQEVHRGSIVRRPARARASAAPKKSDAYRRAEKRMREIHRIILDRTVPAFDRWKRAQDLRWAWESGEAGFTDPLGGLTHTEQLAIEPLNDLIDGDLLSLLASLHTLPAESTDHLTIKVRALKVAHDCEHEIESATWASLIADIARLTSATAASANPTAGV